MGSFIDGHKNAAGGTVPFLKITNDIAIAVDQLGTRKGYRRLSRAVAHGCQRFPRCEEKLGEERRRAHDLFPALWINDMFMKRVVEDGIWTMFDPFDVKELSELYGDAFEKRYLELEQDASIPKEHTKAKDLWKKILTSYFETGSPSSCALKTVQTVLTRMITTELSAAQTCAQRFSKIRSRIII